MKLFAKYYVVIDSADEVSIVKTARTLEQTRKWANDFYKNSVAGESIRVYEKVKNTNKPFYNLIYLQSKAEEKPPRQVGFERW